MKNIYLIETKGKTNLFYDHSGFFWNKTLQTGHSINSSVTGYNIYITNDEKIITNDYVTGTEKDWGLYGEVHQVKFIRELPEGDLLWFNTECNGISANPEQCGKIIFTTDPELFLDVKNVTDEFLEYFCNQSNKNKSPLEFIEISDGKFIFPNVHKHWLDAFNKKNDVKVNFKLESVSQLNEDGTETDITDKAELWHVNKNDDFSIVDESDSECYQEKEFILCASLNHNGVIISGHRHSDCYEILRKLQPELKEYELPQRENQGFLTSFNRYVSRKEAWLIAKENNQIKYGKESSENGEKSELISENLY